MWAHRTLQTLALIAIAMVGLVACSAFDRVVINGDVSCGDTPDDLCMRIAALAIGPASNLDRALLFPVTMQVKPTACTDIGRGPAGPRPAAERCWRVEGEDSSNGFAFGRWVFECHDGTFGLEGQGEDAPVLPSAVWECPVRDPGAGDLPSVVVARTS